MKCSSKEKNIRKLVRRSKSDGMIAATYTDSYSAISSRGHATLHLAVSVGMSVGPSVGPSHF